MAFKISFLLLIFIASSGFRYSLSIPKCYMNIDKCNKYFLKEDERQSGASVVTTTINISKDLKKTISIADSYKAIYINGDGETFLEYRIEQCRDKKYKEFILTNYQLISEHHKTDHHEEGLKEFVSNNMTIYGFTAEDKKNSILGSYVTFPTENIAIYFRFFNATNSPVKLKSVDEFIIERNNLLDSILGQITECDAK